MKQLDKDFYMLSAAKTAVIFGSDKQSLSTPKTQKDASDTDKFAAWGDNNLYPQEFTKKLNKTGAAIGGLEVLISAHYGLGFRLYQDVETEEGVTTRERLRSAFPEIDSFFKTCRWDVTMAEIIEDFETYGIAFVEYLLAPNSDKIVSVKRQQAPHCRLGVPNKKGFVDKVYINTTWGDTLNEELTVEVPFFSDIHNVATLKAYCKEKKIEKFIVPVMRSLTTEKNYPKVKWHSSFYNGWVDVVLSVPSFKKYMFENQLNLKYVIYIADDFFLHKFGREEWQEMPQEKREAARQDLIKGIEVIPIDDKIKDGNFLPDASAGNSEILFPMGVDPCLLGAGIPGGKNLSGSGSDKREAYTILSTRMPVKRLRTLEVFERIRDWNQWDSTLYGNFPNINLTTLDKNPNGQQTIVN